jgi:hypothetical protein
MGSPRIPDQSVTPESGQVGDDADEESFAVWDEAAQADEGAVAFTMG